MKQEQSELNLAEIARKYSTPEKARKWFEGVRWPNGPVCPHCGKTGNEAVTVQHKLGPVVKQVPWINRTEQRAGSKSPSRKGLYRCRGCNEQFTVTVGTVFESSHIPLNKWLLAIFQICGSKKGVSAHQLHRALGVTYKTAWFMAHRIRHALEDNSGELLGGVVEIDETYVGGKPRPTNNQKKGDVSRGRVFGPESKKTPVLALVQRSGKVRTQVVANVTAKNLADFIDANLLRNAHVNTDNFVLYKNIFYPWKEVRHDTVNHSHREYARFNPDGTVAHVNTAESFFSLIKRGVYGSFHHVSREHLFRYCGEFAFRWNHRTLTDGQRTEAAVSMAGGKRLTYRQAI